MLYRSRRADLACEDDVDHLTDLHTLTFGDTAPMAEFDYGAWWLVYPAGPPVVDPIAFCGIVQSSYWPAWGYHKRAGVLAGHRGKGLQLRMIRTREAYARSEGWEAIVTETHQNTPSANNLIRAGYRLFDPTPPWGLKGSLYFRKTLGG